MGSIFMFKRKVSPEEKITAVESYLNGDRKHSASGQYARRDSGHYGANAVMPAFGDSPPD